MVLSPVGDTAPLPPHDPSPSLSKVHQLPSGDWLITSIDGLHLTCRWRLDGRGYDVSSIGPHRVRTGQTVLITDPKMDGYLPTSRPVSIMLSISRGDQHLLSIPAATAQFGRPFSGREKLPLLSDDLNTQGCTAYASRYEGALVVQRGNCTFAEKALHAANAGASLLVIISDEAGLLRPSAYDEDEKFDYEVRNIAVALVEKRANAIGAYKGDLSISYGSEQGQPWKERREGKMVVGDHDLINVRVVDRS